VLEIWSLFPWLPTLGSRSLALGDFINSFYWLQLPFKLPGFQLKRADFINFFYQLLLWLSLKRPISRLQFSKR
jgi:hypothetical protein